MTPTTPEQARGIAAHMMQTSPLYVAYMSLADQVEALTKERDEYRLFADAMAAAHKVERDALAADAARYQWVKKQTRAFSLDMGGQHSWAVTGSFSRAKGPSLDEAIDAAIKAGVQ